MIVAPTKQMKKESSHAFLFLTLPLVKLGKDWRQPRLSWTTFKSWQRASVKTCLALAAEREMLTLDFVLLENKDRLLLRVAAAWAAVAVPAAQVPEVPAQALAATVVLKVRPWLMMDCAIAMRACLLMPITLLALAAAAAADLAHLVAAAAADPAHLAAADPAPADLQPADHPAVAKAQVLVNLHQAPKPPVRQALRHLRAVVPLHLLQVRAAALVVAQAHLAAVVNLQLLEIRLHLLLTLATALVASETLALHLSRS